MFTIDPVALVRFDLRKSGEFVDFWGSHYKYRIADEDSGHAIDYYSEINLGSDLTSSNVLRLLRWKSPQYLSRVRASGPNSGTVNPRVQKVLKRIGSLNDFRAKRIDEATFDVVATSIFPTDGTVWKTFLKHCSRPLEFPIVDQHVHRAFNYHRGRHPDAIVDYTAYQDYFESIHENVLGRFPYLDELHTRKLVDNALMAFGQFLKQYGPAYPLVQVPSPHEASTNQSGAEPDRR